MGKKVIWAIIIVGGLTLLLAHSKTNAGSSPAVELTSPDSDSSTRKSEDSSVSERPSATFAGSPCTSDCSGHEAGYNWAESHGISDEDDCDTAGETSNSPSFAEGCKAYVRGDDPDDEGSDDPNDDSTNDPN